MRARWEAHHASLVRSVTELEGQVRFGKLRASAAELVRFQEPTELVGFLKTRDGGGAELDEKDAIYGALVRAFQSGDHRAIASTLIWLGLWPALDGIYRRRLKMFLRAPEELVSELGYQFTSAVARADLRRIRRVAATLVQNTERLVIDARERHWVAEGLRNDLREDEDSSDLCEDDELAEALSTQQRELSDLGVPAGASVQVEVRALREWLARLVGNDADLVIGAVVYGEAQRETAERLGIPFEYARKRYQRAMERIRRLAPRPDTDLSQNAATSRVSSASAKQAR